MKNALLGKINQKAEKITMIVVYFFSFFCFFPPNEYQYSVPRLFRAGIIVIILIKLIVEIHKERKIEILFAPLLLFFVLRVALTAINGKSSDFSFYNQGIFALAFVAIVKFGIKEDEELFLKSFYFYCISILVANTITLHLWKYLIDVAYTTDSLDGTLLGHKNFIFCFCIPTLFIGEYFMETGMFRGKLAKQIYIFVLVLSLVVELYARAIADLFVLIIWTMVLLLKRTRIMQTIMNPNTAIAVPTALCIGLQLYDPDKWVFLDPLFKLIGRGKTLTGRTVIWKEVRGLIKENWLIGLGDIPGYGEYFNIIHALHAHNLFLNVLLKIGVIGFIPFVLIIVELIRALIHLDNKTLKYLGSAFLFCVLLDVQFDTYYAYYYYGYLALLYFTSLSKMSEEKLEKHYIRLK